MITVAFLFCGRRNVNRTAAIDEGNNADSYTSPEVY